MTDISIQLYRGMPAPKVVQEAVLKIQREFIVTRDSQIPEVGFLISQWTLEEFEGLLRNGATLIAARKEDSVVGYALLAGSDEFQSYLSDTCRYFADKNDKGHLGSLYLYQIATSKVAIGKGVGKAMLMTAKDLAGQKGLFTDVLAKPVNNQSSLAFFKRSGFYEIGTLYLSSYRDFGALESKVLQWTP